jgi:hypothetical protein
MLTWGANRPTYTHIAGRRRNGLKTAGIVLQASRISKIMDYKEKLNQPKWQKRRLEIMQKAGWKCEKCGADKEQLHVHHVDYSSGGPNPWDYEDQHLQCICATCHTLTHIGKERIFKFIGFKTPPPEIRYILPDLPMHKELKEIEKALTQARSCPIEVPDPEYTWKLLKRRSALQRKLREEEGYFC